jgi:hypothetical protein
MKSAVAAAFVSMAFALTRGRILLALLTAHLALALPSVLVFAEAAREASNHRADAVAFAETLDYTTWFDLRAKLRPADMALGFSGLAAFLLGVFASAGWFEVLTKRDARMGFRAFASGAGARMVRFVRLAVNSLLLIAAAGYLFYGAPAELVLRWLTGGEAELTAFASESQSRAFQFVRTGLFTLTLVGIILVSDLSRAVMVVRGGRSALVAGFRGLVLFLRNPVASAAGAAVPFALECSALWAVAWGIELAVAGEANDLNLAALFLLTQAAVVVREVARAGRLGALLAIARDDDSLRFERRYGRMSDPLIAAAGGAMTDEFEG